MVSERESRCCTEAGRSPLPVELLNDEPRRRPRFGRMIGGEELAVPFDRNVVQWMGTAKELGRSDEKSIRTKSPSVMNVQSRADGVMSMLQPLWHRTLMFPEVSLTSPVR